MATKQELRNWVIQELSQITDCAEDITNYIFNIDDLSEVREYFQDFFGENVDKHGDFIERLLNGLKMCSATTTALPDGQWFKKDRDPEILPRKQNKKKKQVEKEEKKKPTRFVPLYSKEGEARTSVRLPGRHPCECLAQKHGLINNCISCGRIVCEQEGAGPCYFCGLLVCSKVEEEVLARDSKKSAKLRKQLMSRTFSDEVSSSKESSDYQKAVEHKNRLLEFDKSSAKRTRVIDDECDYFSTNSTKWMSSKEKEALKNKEQALLDKRHEARRNKKITLDFAGRKVVEDDDIFDMYKVDPEIYMSSSHGNTEEKSLLDSKAFPDLKLEFQPSKSSPSASQKNGAVCNKSSKGLRLQDKELQEMRDPGMCLSMHQPWASLLVQGIKQVEGRSWYTSHRGRLWIAATVKSPSDEEIAAVENMYTELFPNKNFAFPKVYPTACLLGCVDVADCLSNDEYKENCSDNSESESPFVFVCENPQELMIKIPVKGQHKIWKLDSHIHKEAKAAQKN